MLLYLIYGDEQHQVHFERICRFRSCGRRGLAASFPERHVSQVLFQRLWQLRGRLVIFNGFPAFARILHRRAVFKPQAPIRRGPLHARSLEVLVIISVIEPKISPNRPQRAQLSGPSPSNHTSNWTPSNENIQLPGSSMGQLHIQSECLGVQACDTNHHKPNLNQARSAQY